MVSDGWDDRQHRPLVNVLSVSPQGGMFIRSVNTTGQVKNATFLADIMDDAIKDVSPELVVQAITDNAVVCHAAGKIVSERYPHIIISGCAAHAIDLMLEDIYKLGTVNDLVKKDKQVCKTVCNHHASLAAFKSHSDKMILRPNDTR